MTDFLSRFRDGGQLVSQGQFTISARKALEKFGRHAFPRKTAWLTKLLEAVAPCNKAEMKVTVTPEKLSVTLVSLRLASNAETLVQNILDVGKFGFGDPLVDGLRYLAAVCPEQL